MRMSVPGTAAYMAPTSMSKGSPLFTRSVGTTRLLWSPAPALDNTAPFFSWVTVTARPTSNPVTPSGAAGVSGLYESAAPRSSVSWRNSPCVVRLPTLTSPATADSDTSEAARQRRRRFMGGDSAVGMLVGAARFELPTPCTPWRDATRLRYAPRGGVLPFKLG